MRKNLEKHVFSLMSLLKYVKNLPSFTSEKYDSKCETRIDKSILSNFTLDVSHFFYYLIRVAVAAPSLISAHASRRNVNIS